MNLFSKFISLKVAILKFITASNEFFHSFTSLNSMRELNIEQFLHFAILQLHYHIITIQCIHYNWYGNSECDHWIILFVRNRIKVLYHALKYVFLISEDGSKLPYTENESKIKTQYALEKAFGWNKSCIIHKRNKCKR